MKNYYTCEICECVKEEQDMVFLDYHEMCAEVVCDDCFEGKTKPKYVSETEGK